MQHDLTMFEKKIIANIIKYANKNDLVEFLYRQYENLKVIKRTYTGVGFYTEFNLKEKSFNEDEDLSIKIGNIGANLKGLKNGAGFILYIENGEITMLEGYSYDEMWPESEEIEDLYLINNDGTIEKIVE